MTESSKVKRGAVIFCLCIGIYFLFLVLKRDQLEPAITPFSQTSSENISNKAGGGEKAVEMYEADLVLKRHNIVTSQDPASTPDTSREDEAIMLEEKVKKQESLKPNIESPAETDEVGVEVTEKSDREKGRLKEPDHEALSKKFMRTSQDRLLVSIDGKYKGNIEITNQLYTDETGISKLRCTIEVDTSNIYNSDVASTLSIYKFEESEPYFKLSFSGESIFQELQLLEDSRFSIGSADLGHRFELVLSDKGTSISGRLMVTNSSREWKPIGNVRLEKSD